MEKEYASNLLGVNPNSCKPFTVNDPYNNHTLIGFITMSNSKYGSMVISQVNEELCEQVIVGTPKQHYPFDKNGKFRFPITKSIDIFEKYDGTNILAAGYYYHKELYIMYKTRLNPILTASKFGDFKAMWDFILEKYPSLHSFIRINVRSGINLSFELYGGQNKHLIEYNVPLDVAFLFGINNDIKDAVIYAPTGFLSSMPLPLISIIARRETSISSSSDLEECYNDLRINCEYSNEKLEDDTLKGSEGFVWYLRDVNGIVHQYKCKPPSVEEIHWANHSINKNSIRTTVINAYESFDEVNYENVKTLLLEEYDLQSIEKASVTIMHIIKQVNYEIETRNKILTLYKDLNLDLQHDKIGTMRRLSEYFQKKEMKVVYNILKLYVDSK